MGRAYARLDSMDPHDVARSNEQPEHPNSVVVRSAAAALGLHVTIVTYPEGTRTADDAAAAIGCSVAQIVKSLIFLVDGVPTLALVSGSNQLDEKKLTAAAGGSRTKRADADQVREATGFPIGGVPPFGHRQTLPTYVDPDLLGHAEVWAAGGTAHTVFALSPQALLGATGGRAVELRRA